MRRQVVTGVLAVLLVTLGLVSPGQAAEGELDKPSATRSVETRVIDHGRELTEGERVSLVSKEVIERGFVPDESTAGKFTAQATSSCGTAWVTVKSYNAQGQKLWDWNTSNYWCWSGATVTSVNRMTITATRTPLGEVVGWQYEGLVEGPFAQKLTSSSWQSYAQGHYALKPIRVGTIQHKYPWVDYRLNGYGKWTANFGKG